ncbi:hypothetical protein [Bacillus sp. FJAT-45350]|uniref:hypothetical protein n=1 Tax=Bacillus sp. FJAT-45350 TaxID=2011014 RepID=UPI000BB88890|nr:hypothetical protein [Bacillus sp. FJAT-45350]
MNGLIFALFTISLLLAYGTANTLLRAYRLANEDSEKKKWRFYSMKQALISLVSLIIAIWLASS